MYILLNSKFSQSKFFNLLLGMVPLSFIAGNMIININIFLIILSAFFIFGKTIFKIKFYFLDKVIFLFFFLVLITAVINDYYFFSIELQWKGYFTTIFKSILYLKYALLYLVIRFLIEKNKIDLKYFFIFSSLACIFVSFDIFLQYFNGKDIFGYSAIGRKMGGPFGNELIAGSFLQRFSLFSFFLIPFFYTKVSYSLKFLIPILFIIFFSAIILSGNRMPLILFLFSIFLIVIFQRQTRKFFFPFIIIFSLTFYFIFSINKTVKNNFLNFYGQTTNMVQVLLNNNLDDKKTPAHVREFSTFYETWLLNKYIGGGIKNFRYYCHVRPNIPKKDGFICNMHPHNYYLEILTETGLIGLLIISIIFFNTLYLTFYKKYFANSISSYNNLIIPFIFLFIVEIFPIKSTGSFFTTGNASYLFLIFAILIGLTRKDISIENKS